LEPATYLEVGSAGGTLALAECATIAVDPRFHINADVIGRKPMCLLFQEPSDEFFRKHSPRALFGEAIDMAFVDGLHVFDYVLRDFINTEKHCRPNSIVILHAACRPAST
jgi:hypothetical protein